MNPAELIARIREANRHDLYTIGQRWPAALALCDAYETLAAAASECAVIRGDEGDEAVMALRALLGEADQ